MNSTKKMMITSVAAAFLLSSCSSNNTPVASLVSSSFSVNSKAVYLRGEMNDYEVSESYRLRKDDEDTYCTVATLRADWAPYKFKFADADWSDGSNFGFRNPPGILHEGSSPVELTANSKFEEISPIIPPTFAASPLLIVKSLILEFMIVSFPSGALPMIPPIDLLFFESLSSLERFG